jgi:tetratricopeptide (TPR) repeat protein
LKKNLLLSFYAFLAFSCLAQDNVIKNSYHNVTAHYNGYWIANERIIEVENSIQDRYEWDYNRMLPIYPQFDTTTSKSLEDPLLDCIEKASIAIQRHPDSRWQDDAYILVGKARLYGSEFPEAIETFKYVNTNGDLKQDRHKALIQLMRTFIEANEMENAKAVSDFIVFNELNEDAKKELSIVRAYYYQKSNLIPEMSEHLASAVLLMSGDEREPRLSFTLAQAYQALGNDSLAYYHYKKTIRKSKSYELSFYARLNMSQVSQANLKTSEKEIRRYFRKLLKDPKNEEYQGKILFELGNFEAKNDQLQSAISSYRESLEKNRNDTRLKSYTYLKLAEIYYNRLADYELAKSYYDSTANSFPKDEDGYELIANRAEILTDFVKYYNIIQLNDSLLNLAALPKDSLDRWLNLIVSERAVNAEEEAKRKKKEEKRAAIFETSQANSNQNLIDINLESEGTWYFYNTTELSRGFSAFKTKWGQRVLEDNWRRSLKTGGNDNSTVISNEQLAQTSENIQSTPEEEETYDKVAEKAKLEETIPFNPTAKINLESEVEEASYHLGKIYNFELEEKENAINVFEGFVSRFDSSQYLPEVLYQLFLLHKRLDSVKSMYYFTELTTKHDTSLFAKLAINPNYINERDQEIEAYKKIYVKAFDLYENGNAIASQKLIDSALFYNPDNEYVDNLLLLKAMNEGQLGGIYKYQFELTNFISTYSESELVPYAEKLLKTSQDYQINLYSSSKAKYIKNFSTTHYFILVYPLEEDLSNNVPAAMAEYLQEINSNLVSGNIVLDEDHAIILVNEFQNKSDAEGFYAEYLLTEKISTNFAPARFTPMVITTENFQIFYETKDLDSYVRFFSNNYKK